MSQKVFVVLAVCAVLTEAIDSRLPLFGRTGQRTATSAPEMSHEIALEHDMLTSRFEALASRVEETFAGNLELKDSLREQLSLTAQLQTVAEEVPRLTRKLRRAEQDIEDLQVRLSEGCSCVNPGLQKPSGGSDHGTDRDPTEDDWVANMDREMIREMRREMNDVMRDRSNQAPSDKAADEHRGIDLELGVINELSRSLAELVTKSTAQKERNRGMFVEQEDDRADLLEDDRADVDDTEVAVVDAATPRPRPSRLRPGFGFAFQPRGGREVRSRNRRAVTEAQAADELQAAFADVLRSANKKVAFSSIRTEPLLGRSYPQPLSFQKNQANKGKAFDRGSGIFECKIPGIYYFSYTMRSYDDKHIGVALMKNDEAVVAMTTDASNRKVMQTQSTMLSLVEGDQVWLLLGPSENFGIYGNTFNYNTFNGQILYPNYIS